MPSTGLVASIHPILSAGSAAPNHSLSSLADCWPFLTVQVFWLLNPLPVSGFPSGPRTTRVTEASWTVGLANAMPVIVPESNENRGKMSRLAG